MATTELERLLERRASFLSFVQRRVADRELAEDIVQAAYMRAVEHAGKLRESESVVAWFYSVLRHAVIDFYRRRATENSAMERWADEVGAEGEPVVDDPSMKTFVCGCIEHVLPALRPAYAEVLREVDLGELPVAEFARRHELTASNAGVRAHRARAALRRELAKFCGSCSVHGCLDCHCKQTKEEAGSCG